METNPQKDNGQSKAAEAIDYEAIANVCIPVLVDEKGAE